MTTQTLTKTDAAPPLVQLRAQLEQRAEEFRNVLPSHIQPEKFQRTILTAVQANPTLLQCDRRSFLTSAMKAAQDGLLPDGREAAFVVYNTRVKGDDGQWSTVKLVQYLPMVFGLRKKILQSGEIRDLFAEVVYRQEIETGRFVYEEGSQRVLRHKPILDPDFRPSDDDIAVAYSVATFADGSQSFEVMRRWQIDRVREESQSGSLLDAKGQKREAKGPWVDWFPEMAKKTVIRRHSKSLPQSSDIMIDIEGDEIERAARSAVQLLDSQQPDAAKPLLEGGDQAFDADTGEIIEPQITPPPEPEVLPEEPEMPAAPEPEADPVQATPVEPEQPAEPEPDVDEIGITKAPEYAAAERLAEDYITRARACETIIDFRKLEKEADLVVCTMPEEIQACIDTEFDHTRNRLKPAKADA